VETVGSQPAHKTCSKCRAVKSRSDFNKDQHAEDDLRHACRECNKKAYKKWYSSEEGKAKKQAYDKSRDKVYIKAKNGRWRSENPERHRQNVKQWREANPEKVREYELNRGSRAEWYREKRRTDMNYRIAQNLRGRLRQAIRSQLQGSCVKKGSAVEHLGCSMDELISHEE